MNDIPISERLKAVASLITPTHTLADIGSDHAYLPCYAFLEGRIKKGIAGEINVGPYRSALSTIEKYGLSEHITARLGDGLSVIEKDEADCITIAGMGGELIRRILEAGKDRLTDATRLILQPNVGEHQVRLWLMANDFTIDQEMILEEDGHIYEIIQAQKNDQPKTYSAKELMFGPILLQEKSDTFLKKWRAELKKRERVWQSLGQAVPSPEIAKRRFAIEKEIQWINEVTT
jgi:tRNA (adenine22-N1)-methyltransferase